MSREDLGDSWMKADERQREAWLRAGIVPLDYPDPVAADWPDLLAIVRSKSNPDGYATIASMAVGIGGSIASAHPDYMAAIVLRSIAFWQSTAALLHHLNFAFLPTDHGFCKYTQCYSASTLAQPFAFCNPGFTKFGRGSSRRR